MKSLISIMGLEWKRNFGAYEFAFALYPLLLSYPIGGVPGLFFWLILLDLFALSKKKLHKYNVLYNYYSLLFGFVVIHELIWFFVVDSVSQTHINIVAGEVFIMISFFIITPVLNFEKLKGPFYILALICTLGLFYHARIVISGQSVSQLTLPFLPTPTNTVSFDNDFSRPMSFFQEPQAYCTYMLIPLYLFLTNKKFLFSFVVILTMLLSTSTTGMYTSLIMLLVYVLSQDVDRKVKLIVIVASIVVILLLLNNELFQTTIEMAEKKKFSENERTSVGTLIFSQLGVSDILIGIPYMSVGNMYDAGKLNGDFMLLGNPGSTAIFVPSFWSILFKLGIFGLFLYLLVYWQLIKNKKYTWPYTFVLIATLFSNPDGLGVMFIYQLAFTFCMIVYNEKIKKTKNEMVITS